MINKYIKSSHISERQTRSILKYFSLDFEATKIASLTGVSRQSINRILLALRERIVCPCEQESVFEKGSVEFDESYFGAKRIRGKRGRGAKGKHIVFSLIKRGGNVYTQIVSNCLVNERYSIILSKVSPIQRSIRTALKLTTDWLILAIKNTIESIMETMSLRMVTITLTVLKTFGDGLRRGSRSSEEYPKRPSICI